MVVLKRVGILSLAKLEAGVMAAFGLLTGLFVAAFGNVDPSGFGAFIGVGAIIGLPIASGVGGFVSGAVFAFIYNLFAGWIGGIEFEFEEEE